MDARTKGQFENIMAPGKGKKVSDSSLQLRECGICKSSIVDR